MRSYGGLSILILILLGAANGRAQVTTWMELEKKALESNSELLSLKSQVSAAEFQSRAAYGSYWPQLNLFADETRQDSKDYTGVLNPQTYLVTLKTQRRYTTVDSFGFKSTLNLFKGFADKAQTQVANAQAQSARWQYQLKSIEVRSALRTAFIQAVMAKKSQKTSEKIWNQQKRNRDLIRIKYQTGLEAAWALDQANAAVQLAELQKQIDEENLKQAQEKIEHLVKSPVVLPEADDSFDVGPLKASDSIALKDHPQIQIQSENRRQAEAQRLLSHAAFYPSLDASYTWSQSQEKGEDSSQNNAVSLTLTWNIFDGTASRSRSQAALAQEMSARAMESNIQEQLTLDLLQKRRNYELNRQLLQLKKTELSAALSRSETVSNQYRNGLRKYQDWEAAETRLIDLEREIIDVEKNTLLLRTSWEQSAGQKLGDL